MKGGRRGMRMVGGKKEGKKDREGKQGGRRESRHTDT